MYSEILVGLTGLTPGREYCAEMVAHRVDVLMARAGSTTGTHRKKAKLTVRLSVGARTLAKTLTVRL
jgi:hypothetical protein